MAKMEYKIKDIILTEEELIEIHEYYEAACTANYLMDQYGFDEEKALELGYEVRRQMDKYGFDEEEAISEVLEDEDIEE